MSDKTAQPAAIDCTYNSDIVCPHCAFAYTPAWVANNKKEAKCVRCGGKYSLVVVHVERYSTAIIGDRVTA